MPLDDTRLSSTMSVAEAGSHRRVVASDCTADASNAVGTQIASSAVMLNSWVIGAAAEVSGSVRGSRPSARAKEPPDDQMRPSNVSSEVSRQ